MPLAIGFLGVFETFQNDRQNFQLLARFAAV